MSGFVLNSRTFQSSANNGSKLISYGPSCVYTTVCMEDAATCPKENIQRDRTETVKPSDGHLTPKATDQSRKWESFVRSKFPFCWSRLPQWFRMPSNGTSVQLCAEPSHPPALPVENRWASLHDAWRRKDLPQSQVLMCKPAQIESVTCMCNLSNNFLHISRMNIQYCALLRFEFPTTTAPIPSIWTRCAFGQAL